MRMWKTVSGVIAATALLLVAVPSSADAQSESATATITVPEVLFVDIDVNSVDFPDATAADFEAGSITFGTSTTLEHKGNVAHDVEITSSTGFFQNSGGDTSKPASDLEWSLNGGSSWNNGLGTTPAAVVTGAVAGQHTESVDYRLLLDYATDAPDTYDLEFTYTVVAN